MVAVHDIPLDQYDGGSVGGAVAFSLSAQSRRNRVHRFQAEGWEVELRGGRDHIVARTNQTLAGDALIDAAIDYAHRALDITSVEDGEHLVTTAPASDHIVFERLETRRIVRFHTVIDFPISIDVKATVTRGDGTVVPPPVRPLLAWVPAFRFHRLSQSSRDLFDAYRNMFLGLEALLDQLFPKNIREGEKAWLLRSIVSAGAKVDLARLATPGATDPARDLVDLIYRVRVHLFHAKTGRSLIPDDPVSYIEVAETYPVLLALWTAIVRAWLSMERDSSVVTYQGFRTTILCAYGSAKIGIDAGDTLLDKAVDETEAIPRPRGLPMSVFAESPQIVEVRPGRIGLHGRTDVSALPKGQVVGRVLVVGAEGAPLIISSINGRLTLDGADMLEAKNILRLINRGQPRTEFS